MKNELVFFGNDRLKLLKFLYDKRTKYDDYECCLLNQQEISDLAHFTKKTTNRIINELIDGKYLVTYLHRKGKYIITDKGKYVLDIFGVY